MSLVTDSCCQHRRRTRGGRGGLEPPLVSNPGGEGGPGGALEGGPGGALEGGPGGALKEGPWGGAKGVLEGGLGGWRLLAKGPDEQGDQMSYFYKNSPSQANCFLTLCPVSF